VTSRKRSAVASSLRTYEELIPRGCNASLDVSQLPLFLRALPRDESLVRAPLSEGLQ
jgi:hypothetical protein